MLTTSIDLIKTFDETRKASLAIAKPLKTEDMVVQPVEEVSPIKWHLGHTTWFFESFILEKFKGYTLYNEDFKYLLNSYYENMGARILRNRRGTLTRPTLQEILDYRSYVDDHLKTLLEKEDHSKEIIELVILGINHEQQHQELMWADIKFILGIQPLFPHYSLDSHQIPAFENPCSTDMISIDEGIYEIGFQGEGFSFDNEHSRHKTYLQNFQIRKGLVSNEEYIEFINQGGYENSDLWHSEGWAWLKEQYNPHPLYWVRKDEGWFTYEYNGLQTLDAKEPVKHINYYEASAFAQWKGMRLPTEFEWEVASENMLWGDLWEWTQSAYLPYPGFEKASGAVGEYNGKFMVNQQVLRGKSIVTPTGHSRKTYRNFWHPHYQWQFTGIRLVK